MTAAIPSAANMLSVLKLFLIPVGGGIPAGVILAQTKGVAWPLTAILYAISDIALAVAFEPILRLFAVLCGKVSVLARVGAALRSSADRTVSHFGGTGAGPLALIMISFGVDPMTSRASAHAAGHGFVAGWAFAIAGDMLYFAVIAISTLRLNTYIRDPNVTSVVILVAMLIAPVVVRFIRSRLGVFGGTLR